MLRTRLYLMATLLIVAGVVMLCQPFVLAVHVWAFPVLLGGVAMFVVLDHLPEFTSTRRHDLEQQEIAREQS